MASKRLPLLLLLAGVAAASPEPRGLDSVEVARDFLRQLSAENLTDATTTEPETTLPPKPVTTRPPIPAPVTSLEAVGNGNESLLETTTETPPPVTPAPAPTTTAPPSAPPTPEPTQAPTPAPSTPAPTQPPTAAPTSSPAVVAAPSSPSSNASTTTLVIDEDEAVVSLQMTIGGVDFAALEQDAAMKQEFVTAIEAGIVQEFNSRASGYEISEKDIETTLRQAPASSRLRRRLSSGGVIAESVITVPAVGRAVDVAQTLQSAKSSLETTVSTKLQAISDIADVTLPGQTIDVTGTSAIVKQAPPPEISPQTTESPNAGVVSSAGRCTTGLLGLAALVLASIRV